MRPGRPFYCAHLLDSELGSNLNCFGPPPWGLEPECLLLELDAVVGLFLLHSMHQSWSYAWVSCPHTPTIPKVSLESVE
jgi:hypothetical protein